jgi:hypothetical protein
MSTNTQKLRVLRSRTDHDLVVVLSRELDRGFALVNAVRSRNSPLFAQAVEAYDTAKSLLPRISGISQDDRLRTEDKVKELRSLLDQVPVYANMRPYPTAFAS